ncbi:MAG: sensor histidine kinase [Betaproteobacteria bacterium]|nr:sensor histidine kinase [Betaproteobacteria bacterium]
MKRQRVGSNVVGGPLNEATESRAAGNQPRGDMSNRVATEEALRAARAQMWRLSAQHLSIQEGERRRIAAELHDGLGQVLSLVKLNIEEAASSVDAGAIAKTKNTLERLSSQVKTALGELRRIAMNLRPSTLDDLGIVATLSWCFREFEAAYPNMKFERDISVDEADVPEPLKISIFRIVQEATSNALKHAKGERITVSLTISEGFLNLAIEDNGRGFDTGRAAEQRDFKHGIGLQSMRERAELSGGSYEFQSSPGQGTRVSVKWLRVEASERDCPIIPVKQALAQSMCRSALSSDLPEDFSVCLTCVRSLECH